MVEVKVPSDARIPHGSFWHRFPMLAAMVGVIALGFWASTVKAGPERAMYSYLFAYLSIISLALGCMGFVIIQHLSRAGWSIAVRRVPEAAMATMPLFVVLFIPIWLYASDIFEWMHPAPLDAMLQRKLPYLNMSFFSARAIGYFLVWIFISMSFYKWSVKQDDGKNPELTRKLWGFSAPSVLLFGLTISFAAFDWLMSLQPHWYSTIFGVYYFAGSFLSAICLISLLCMALQSSGAMKQSVTQEHYHDLGKFAFGFTVFWAYIAFSQFMLYWYGNIPEEVEFYMHRMHHGWEVISWALPITNFFIPFFFLMSRHVKKYKPAFAFMCVWVIVFHFVDLYWVAMPAFGAGESAEPVHMHVSAGDIAALVGILSLFLAYTSFLLVRRNVIPTGDPRLGESLAFENF